MSARVACIRPPFSPALPPPSLQHFLRKRKGWPKRAALCQEAQGSGQKGRAFLPHRCSSFSGSARDGPKGPPFARRRKGRAKRAMPFSGGARVGPKGPASASASQNVFACFREVEDRKIFVHPFILLAPRNQRQRRQQRHLL